MCVSNVEVLLGGELQVLTASRYKGVAGSWWATWERSGLRDVHGDQSTGGDESLWAGVQGWGGLAKLCRRILHRVHVFSTPATFRLV